MNTLPTEVRFNEFWQYLDYQDIVRLCETDVMFSKICEFNYVWQYLIKRDFGFIYVEENARSLYLLYNRALNVFSKYLPIITQTALSTLVTYIPTSEWNDLELSLKAFLDDYDDTPKIFTVNTLFYILSNGAENYVIPSSFRKYYEILEEVADVKVLYPDFDQILEVLNDCNNFRTMMSRPTLIFINKELTVIEYDYELVEQLAFERDWMLPDSCINQRYQIEKELIAKLMPL